MKQAGAPVPGGTDRSSAGKVQETEKVRSRQPKLGWVKRRTEGGGGGNVSVRRALEKVTGGKNQKGWA